MAQHMPHKNNNFPADSTPNYRKPQKHYFNGIISAAEKENSTQQSHTNLPRVVIAAFYLSLLLW
jgi:hypothetical protein